MYEQKRRSQAKQQFVVEIMDSLRKEAPSPESTRIVHGPQQLFPRLVDIVTRFLAFRGRALQSSTFVFGV